MSSILTSFYFPSRVQDDFELALSREITVDGRTYKLSAIVMFFTFQIFGGHIGIPLVLLTLYIGKGLRRHPELVNFLVTFVIYSTSFCILLYLGKQFGPEPPHGLCTFQASSIYGTAVLTCTAGLCYVLNLWLGLRDVVANTSAGPMRRYILLAAPYVLFVAFVIFTAVLGASKPQLVSRNRYLFYCTINSKLVDIVPGLGALMIVTVIAFEAMTAYQLYRMYKSLTSLKSDAAPPLHLIIRVGIFSVYAFLAIVACIGFWSKAEDELPYVIQASVPTAAFLIFGSQRDVLQAWGVIKLWNWIMRNPKAPRIVNVGSKPLPPLPAPGVPKC